MTKRPVQEQTWNSTKHAEQQDGIDILNKLFCVLWIFQFLFFILDLLK